MMYEYDVICINQCLCLLKAVQLDYSCRLQSVSATAEKRVVDLMSSAKAHPLGDKGYHVKKVRIAVKIKTSIFGH